MIRHLDLFSGIGGNSLAADWAWGGDVEHIFCEIDPFCRDILKKHWPEAKIYEDIKKLEAGAIGPIDLVTGGFPCQPFSTAGDRKGKDDVRDLWPEMFRIITECRPTWVCGENVAGFIGMELDRSISDLESAGYAVQTFNIPAIAVDARHFRHRIWIVAHRESGRRSRRGMAVERDAYEEGIDARRSGAGMADADGIESERRGKSRELGSAAAAESQEALQWQRPGYSTSDRRKDMADGNRVDGEGSDLEDEKKRPRAQRSLGLRNGAGRGLAAWPAEPRVGRVAHGISKRVDRIKALGNSIVPQVAAQIFYAIKEADASYNDSK